MTKPGLYLACYGVDPDERLTAQGLPPVRLGLFIGRDAHDAHRAALAAAAEQFPPEQGYTGHRAYLETAPLEWLKTWLPLVGEVERFSPDLKIDHTPLAASVEEWPDRL